MIFLLTVLTACIFDKDLSIWIYLLSFLITYNAADIARMLNRSPATA